ncbi:hypothetical protein NS330_15110, partial [Curtobacterium citreum]
MRLGGARRGRTEPAHQVRVPEQPLQRGGQRRRVPRGHQQAVLAVLHHVDDAGDRRRDDRTPGGHRL